MPAMRVRKPFAGAFVGLLLASAYLGLSTQKIPSYGQSDKGLHFVTFFLLTVAFYWILETSRRRCIHLTLLVCTAGLAIGSEVVQALLPNGRDFDPYDILANVVGSALGLALCSWYHKRMLERKRQTKNYDLAPGELGDEDGERDVELGYVAEQETGTVSADTNGSASDVTKKTDVSEELDKWDENEEDWDDDQPTSAGDKQRSASTGQEGADSKKRAD